jgi:menaquinone-9 beta-reductase
MNGELVRNGRKFIMLDLIIVGGGIAGSALALAISRTGASVLLLESELRFRDRIRGELLHVWGTVDAKALGIYELLLSGCAHELEFMTHYRDGVVAGKRHLSSTTQWNGKEMTFFHPAMQETLIDAARDAGTEVWRGATVTDVGPRESPGVSVLHDGSTHTLNARLIIGADGRRSKVRKWMGFETNRDPNSLMIAGALVSGVPANTSEHHLFSRTDAAWTTQFIPLATGQYRSYFITGDRKRHALFGGKTGADRFSECAIESCVPANWIETMCFEGPIASFEGASWWVDYPYQQGVALIGDAAAAPDPAFGNGLAKTLRDVNVLRHCLLEQTDWDAAARTYSREHSGHFSALRTLEDWTAQARYSTGPEMQAVRDHASSAFVLGDAPDLFARGPDQPTDEAARLRFLGY